jgi:osmotically inducible protein OsmC
MNTPEKIVYTSSATSHGGRTGHVSSDDGVLDLALAAPKETGGPGGAANPEQLFAAGYSACFQGALALVAKKESIDTSLSVVTAEVGFGPEGNSYAIAVTLRAAVPGVERDVVAKLMEAAHEVCPYSKATRGNVPVELVAEAA